MRAANYIWSASTYIIISKRRIILENILIN
jgi:hypothetical protein